MIILACERNAVHNFHWILFKFAQYDYIYETSEAFENEQVLIICLGIISPWISK